MPGVAATAFVVAVVLGIAGLRTGHRVTRLAAMTWLGYAGYEWLMAERVLCSGECNIRIDLLLLWPALALATLITLAKLWRDLRRQRRRA